MYAAILHEEDYAYVSFHISKRFNAGIATKDRSFYLGRSWKLGYPSTDFRLHTSVMGLLQIDKIGQDLFILAATQFRSRDDSLGRILLFISDYSWQLTVWENFHHCSSHICDDMI